MTVPRAEYEDRISRIRDRMAERGFDALLIWGEPRGSLGLLAARNDIGYVTDWPIRHAGTGACLVVLPADGPPVLLVSGARYARPHAERIAHIRDVRLCAPDRFADEARAVLGERGVEEGRIGIVRRDDLPKRIYDTLTAAFREDCLDDASGIFAALRAVKSPAQIDALRESARVADAMFETFRETVSPGVERATPPAEMEHTARTAGAEFATTWISSGPLGGGFPSFEARRTRGEFREGDLVVVGLQIVHDDHWGHAIRAGVVGEPSAEQRELFGVVRAAEEELLRRAEPGTELGELRSAVEAVYGEAGYESSFRSLHGLGLRYGGPPAFPQPGGEFEGSAASRELEPGMVFEVHPNIWGGPDGDRFAAIGDMAVVTEDGTERLTGTPRGLFEF